MAHDKARFCGFRHGPTSHGANRFMAAYRRALCPGRLRPRASSPRMPRMPRMPRIPRMPRGPRGLITMPIVNACLNGISAAFLGAGYYFIRRKNVMAHRNCMISAFVASTLFLACYITYHGYLAYYLHRGPTVFREPGWFRPIYLG